MQWKKIGFVNVCQCLFNWLFGAGFRVFEYHTNKNFPFILTPILRHSHEYKGKWAINICNLKINNLCTTWHKEAARNSMGKCYGDMEKRQKQKKMHGYWAKYWYIQYIDDDNFTCNKTISDVKTGNHFQSDSFRCTFFSKFANYGVISKFTVI